MHKELVVLTDERDVIGWRAITLGQAQRGSSFEGWIRGTLLDPYGTFVNKPTPLTSR